jgi:hypothetical protein
MRAERRVQALYQHLTSADAPSGPLDGVKVVDMTSVMAGPLTGAKLADMGASVVKVENINGDPYRNAGTKATLPSGERLGSSFAVCNRGKRSINGEWLWIQAWLLITCDIVALYAGVQ